MANLELGADEDLHLEETDVNCAFYRIKAPEGMSSYFLLPCIAVRYLRGAGVAGLEGYSDSDNVSPEFLVMAMGFSWSLYFCQRLVENVVLAAGFSVRQFVYDRQRAPPVAGGEVAFAVYVDGVGALSSDAALA